jgi:hypothetical protein
MLNKESFIAIYSQPPAVDNKAAKITAATTVDLNLPVTADAKELIVDSRCRDKK